MHEATLAMTGAKHLVTKDSGDAGGVEEKLSAAISCGCEGIVIRRPVSEEGHSLAELLDLFAPPKESVESPAFFPLFVDMRGKKVLVIGAGNVAKRRIGILSSYGADITVIAPEVPEAIEGLASACLKRKYQRGDIAAIQPFLVLAASNDRQANHEARQEAGGLDIPISLADCREACTCYFPAIVENTGFIAGLVSKNGDHTGVKKVAEGMRKLL